MSTSLVEIPELSLPKTPPADRPRCSYCKFDATAAPAVTDDFSKGYSKNAIWYKTTATIGLWICVDNTTGAAVWKEIPLTTTIADDSVANAKLANMATKTYKGRTSSGTGDPEDVAVATLKTDLVLVKGDVGLGNVDNVADASKPVSTAQAAADAAVYAAAAGDATTKANAAYAAAIPRANHTGTQLAATISDFNATARAAVGIKALNADYSNSLSGAITSIGATPTVLIVDADATISTALTIPATLWLQPVKGAKLIKSASGAITFQGFGLADPLSQIPLFSGFANGNITWAGASVYPAKISSALWDETNWGLRLNRASNAFTSQQVEIQAYPLGTPTAQIRTYAGQSVYFNRGTYENAIAMSSQACWIAESNTEIYGPGMGQVFLKESSAATSVRLFYASGVFAYPFDGYNENISIHDFTILGQSSASTDTSAAAIDLGNCTNGTVHHICFDHTHGYAAFVGGNSTSGYWANGCWIVDNIALGLQTQNFGTTGGDNIHISRNISILGPSSASQAVIDVEPNTNTDGSDNIQITDNIIDARLAQTSCNGITVQQSYSANVRNVKVAGNQIIGCDLTRVVFLDSEVNLSTNTITTYSHGFATGQPVSLAANDAGGGHSLPAGFTGTNYDGFVIRLSGDTLKIASTYANAIAGTAVDITGTGYGEYCISPRRVLSNGIQIFTVQGATVEDNLVIGASQAGIDVQGVYKSTFKNNTLIACGGGGNYAMTVLGCVDCDFSNNNVQSSALNINQNGQVLESDGAITVNTTSGSPNVTVVSDHTYAWWVRGRPITIDSVVYTIRERVGNLTLILTANAASTLSSTSAVIGASSNRYRDNDTGGITLSTSGSSVEYSKYTDYRKKGTVTIDPASVAATTVSSQTFTLTGAVTGDNLILNPPAAGLTAGLLVLQAFVSATDTITVVFYNTTAGAIDEASASWTYTLLR